RAVGIPLVSGRDFSYRDSSKARRVAILSQSLARRLFGGSEPLGQRIRIGLTTERLDVAVVGIASDARLYDVQSANMLSLYVPAPQSRNPISKCIVIRGADVSYAALKQAVESLGHDNLGNMVTLRYITDRALLQERLTATLSGFFGALALLLTA